MTADRHEIKKIEAKVARVKSRTGQNFFKPDDMLKAPKMSKKLRKGKRFLSELDENEM